MSDCDCNGACACACADCGGAATTPPVAYNPPGQDRIAYRAGTYRSFYGRMVAGLSGQQAGPLRQLHTRERGDPSIALLDAWAVAADILSFYNERIANEAYLRTATERRSVLELARLTGYRLRPGVAASVYLAYQLDANAGALTIPVGTRSQSVPGPGEQMQTFETAEPLEARARWNAIRPRLTQPQLRSAADIVDQPLYLRGVSTRLKVNDALLVDFGMGGQHDFHYYRVGSVALDEAAGRTRIGLRAWSGGAGTQSLALPGWLQLSFTSIDTLIRQLGRLPNLQPRNALRLRRDPAQAFVGGADVYPQLLKNFQPALDARLYDALVNAPVAQPVPVRVYALRVAAPLFAHNAPHQPAPGLENHMVLEPPDYVVPTITNTWGPFADLPGDGPDGLPHIALDRVYDTVRADADSWVVVDRPFVDGFSDAPDVPAGVSVHRVGNVRTATMSTPAGAALEVTQLDVESAWLRDLGDRDRMESVLESTAALRGTRVYAQSEPLELAEEPLAEELGDERGRIGEIELDGLYDGLKPGRWLFVNGERSDMGDVRNVAATELVMLAAVRNGVRMTAGDTGGGKEPPPPEPLPGERIHTFITLAEPLAYRYRRASVTLQANVVRATHGETRHEVLGGGDPTKAFQQLALKQGPLTHVAASTETGADSTLAVRVNGLLWHEHVALVADGQDARAYVTRRNDAEQTSVVFGDGMHGQRPPGGADNIRAVYRSGIGVSGNVGAGQITLATDKPLGVAGVVNPLRASGGADPDRLEQARRNAPPGRDDARPARLGARLCRLRAGLRRHRQGHRHAAAQRRQGGGGRHDRRHRRPAGRPQFRPVPQPAGGAAAARRSATAAAPAAV